MPNVKDRLLGQPLFQSEARFGRINDVRCARAPKPIRPLCTAMLAHEYLLYADQSLCRQLIEPPLAVIGGFKRIQPIAHGIGEPAQSLIRMRVGLE